MTITYMIFEKNLKSTNVSVLHKIIERNVAPSCANWLETPRGDAQTIYSILTQLRFCIISLTVAIIP